ncbi:MAG: hypothetical protein HY763_14420 [Planctomycetes bacterium]|nr:hypothetical protein [Planctomycetota bacterium]
MVVELHNMTRPARPGRAIASSVFLLLVTVGLAAQMSAARGRDPLVRAVSPPGWLISVRPPKHFRLGEEVHTRKAVALPFFGRAASGAEAVLALWRVEQMDGGSPRSAAELILGRHDAEEGSHPVDARESEAKPLGPREGAELFSWDRTTVVRAAVFRRGDAYAVSVSLEDRPIDEDLYRLFDLTCRSLEYHDD